MRPVADPREKIEDYEFQYLVIHSVSKLPSILLLIRDLKPNSETYTRILLGVYPYN